MASGASGQWSWILGLALLGFVISAVSTTVLELDRGDFVAIWAVAAALVWGLYSRRTRITIRTQLERRWIGGLVAGLVIGALLVVTVLRQPGSDAPGGGALVMQGLWLGLVYGLVDALMLSILPVLILYAGRPAGELQDPVSRLRWAAAALLGSAVVAAAYHAGFREFRNASLLGPVIGNLVITFGYLASGSPIAPLLAHVMMHLAALIHGPATTVQLPPHY
jgi:hypothetical protein